MFADYSKCPINLACSILKEFGMNPPHATLPCMDAQLKQQYQNIVVLLLDGMGTDALRRHLEPDGFFRSHLKESYSSVFPPTTTAATTSLDSGLAPCEHGWLGWSLYFSEIDKIVNAFPNTEKDSDRPAADFHVANRYLHYQSIIDRINGSGNGEAYSVSKFGTVPINSFPGLVGETVRLCRQKGRKYIYAYWENPDALMHQHGCYDASVTENLRELEDAVREMANGLSDTLLIVTADHGHCDITYYILSDYPELTGMLKRPVSMEARATAFYVKEEFLAVFPEKFNEIFGDDFLLFSKNELKQKNIFGDGKPHAKFDELTGDFLAAAISDKGIAYSRNSNMFKSNHAGMTEKEMRIPFIAVSRK